MTLSAEALKRRGAEKNENKRILRIKPKKGMIENDATSRELSAPQR